MLVVVELLLVVGGVGGEDGLFVGEGCEGVGVGVVVSMEFELQFERMLRENLPEGGIQSDTAHAVEKVLITSLLFGLHVFFRQFPQIMGDQITSEDAK